VDFSLCHHFQKGYWVQLGSHLMSIMGLLLKGTKGCNAEPAHSAEVINNWLYSRKVIHKINKLQCVWLNSIHTSSDSIHTHFNIMLCLNKLWDTMVVQVMTPCSVVGWHKCHTQKRTIWNFNETPNLILSDCQFDILFFVSLCVFFVLVSCFVVVSVSSFVAVSVFCCYVIPISFSRQDMIK
jgi:hypothetical protein